MIEPNLIEWLLQGDVSIQYQVHRDLLDENREDLQARIATEGWGARFLSYQKPDGHWGKAFYEPKWISTHYTLLDLRNLGIDPKIPVLRDSVNTILKEEKGPDGGVRPIGAVQLSDVCLNGMFLNYASYFGAPETELQSVVDFILSQRMPDGGYNCRLNRSGARHSSLHSTISVAEGIRSYQARGYTYRLSELLESERSSREFILLHQLYLSDRTGEVIRKDFLRFFYPCRWYYDILRALDYFCLAQLPYDPRMEPALQQLNKKRRKDGRWTASKRPGKIHFEMEASRAPSRWNTLRALRVIKHFKR